MTNTVADITPEGSAAYSHLKDKMGRLRTQSLFIEMKNPNYPAPFTLKQQDHKGALSMYRKYMELGDPTEYSTAIALLGSWRHWQVLTACEWFQEHITKWRSELAVKFESDRYQEMVSVSVNQNGTPAGVAATKWLADRYSNQKNAPKRGRPSAAEKKLALKEESEEDKLLNEEAERLGL